MDNLAKIGIDLWSILLYMVNYGLIFIVIAFVLFPKIKAILGERKATIEKNLTDAETLRKELDALVKKSQVEKDQLMELMEKERQNARKDIEAQKAKMIEEMETDRSKLLADANKQIKEQQKNIIIDSQKQILKMIESTITTILSGDVPEDVVKKSVKDNWEAQKETL